MALRVVIPPATPGLVTLAQAKAQLRLELSYEDEDLQIGGAVLAASNAVEGAVQRRYIAQTLEWVREGWADEMVIPVAPWSDGSAMEIVSVSYVDLNGVTQVLDPSQYWARPEGRTLKIVRRWFVIWPWLGDGAERVVIRFSVTGDVTTVPANVAQATLLLVSHYYQNRDAVVGVENRDSSTPLPLGVDHLLSSELWA